MKIKESVKNKMIVKFGEMFGNISFIMRNCLDADSVYNNKEELELFLRGCKYRMDDCLGLAENEANYDTK